MQIRQLRETTQMSISITENQTFINKYVVKQLGTGEFVDVLINRRTRQLAIQISREYDKDKIRLPGKVDGLRITTTIINQVVENIMNWDLTKHYYTVKGTYHKEENAIIFDLDRAKQMERIARRKRK